MGLFSSGSKERKTPYTKVRNLLKPKDGRVHVVMLNYNDSDRYMSDTCPIHVMNATQKKPTLSYPVCKMMDTKFSTFPAVL